MFMTISLDRSLFEIVKASKPGATGASSSRRLVSAVGFCARHRQAKKLCSATRRETLFQKQHPVKFYLSIN
jgi:hypothetical protein